MTTEKEQLEAEIAERDARLAELEAQKNRLIGGNADLSSRVRELEHKMDYYKARPSAGVVLPERKPVPDQSMFVGRPAAYAQAFDEAKAHNRCLDEVERLNPCRAQAVADDLRAAAENCALVMRYIGSMGPDEIDGDNVELLFEDEDGRDIGVDASIVEYAEKVADLLDAMLAAPSANSEQARACATCNGVGIIGHGTLCPECATAPSTQQKESGDE